jgi:hypothetical protein
MLRRSATSPQKGFPVAVTCRVLDFSTQAFYQCRTQPVTDRDWADAHLSNASDLPTNRSTDPKSFLGRSILGLRPITACLKLK